MLGRPTFKSTTVILSLSKDDGLARPAPFDRLRVLDSPKSRCNVGERQKARAMREPSAMASTIK
jgi:hypothetical protein